MRLQVCPHKGSDRRRIPHRSMSTYICPFCAECFVCQQGTPSDGCTKYNQRTKCGPAHYRIPRNEAADQLAKAGASGGQADNALTYREMYHHQVSQ